MPKIFARRCHATWLLVNGRAALGTIGLAVLTFGGRK